MISIPQTRTKPKIPLTSSPTAMSSTDNSESTVQPIPTEQDALDDVQEPSSNPDTPVDNSLETNDEVVGDAPQSQTQTPPSPPPNMPPSTDSDASSVPIQAQIQGGENPALASLKAIFPDFDDGVLLSVLDSVGGDQDRALDIILGMNDPDYVSQTVELAVPVASQTDLDEQLARRLMLEEQMAHQASIPRQPETVTYDPVPYEARVHQARAPIQQPPPGGERDTITEFQEHFNKFAETGKRTIGSLFAKVKAKVSEFEQQRATNQAFPWNSTGAGAPPVEHQTHPSYYDPNLPVQDMHGAVQGYDVNQPMPPIHVQDTAYTPSSTRPIADNSLAAQPTDTNRSSSSMAAEAVPSSQTNTAAPAANIDPSKLGLLPKRPVSLLQPVPPPPRRGSDDDDLEYVENPFEDDNK